MNSVGLDFADRPFDNILNFRDVGKSVNRLHGFQILKEGILFRSARLDEASKRDRQRLTDELCISSVIDLRSSTEHRVASRKKPKEIDPSDPKGSKDSVDPMGPAGADGAHLVHLSGVRRYLVSLTGKVFEKALVWRLDWFNFMKALSWLISGYHEDTARLVIRESMRPRGLIGISVDQLDYSGSEVKKAFDIFAENETYPAIIHCSQGKDRTGLVVLLLLLLTNVVPQDVITADYMKSQSELHAESGERLKEIRELGLSDDFAQCPSRFVEEIKSHLDSTYGGVEGYLVSVGVDCEKQERIRRKLLA